MGLWIVFIGGIAATLYFTLRNSSPASGNTVTPELENADSGDSTGTYGDATGFLYDYITPQPAGDLQARITRLASAIAYAEGFGKPGAIPTIYHNPGDLKPPDGSNDFWAGQTGVGKGGHAIFASDATGFAALYRQIRIWQSGKSTVIQPFFSFQQAAYKYAENWQPWLANVTKVLGVKPTDSLEDFFDGKI